MTNFYNRNKFCSDLTDWLNTILFIVFYLATFIYFIHILFFFKWKTIHFGQCIFWANISIIISIFFHFQQLTKGCKTFFFIYIFHWIIDLDTQSWGSARCKVSCFKHVFQWIPISWWWAWFHQVQHVPGSTSLLILEQHSNQPIRIER